MSTIDEARTLREKFTCFRILVIGRANAGKTTLLKRVCNTTEEPCIYDGNYKNLLEPTSQRGIHDIERPFVFKSNPRFIFHDSPGFEAGDERQLNDVLSFIEKRSKSNDVDDQLHAIWFCFFLNAARPLLELEERFFNEQRAGNVPVIAIFTKFDDLVSQVYDMNREDAENVEAASRVLEERFEQPLKGYRFPPRAYVRFQAIHEDTSNHQDQVKGLIENTAASLDTLALKMLFVSVQQNNLELCIQYAIDEIRDWRRSEKEMILQAVAWFGHCFYPSGYDYGNKEERHFIEHANLILSIFWKLKFRSPTLKDFAAVLICLENSFWTCHQGVSFEQAFKESWRIYVSSGTKERIGQEISGQQLNVEVLARESESEKRVTFLNIILQNLLPRPDVQ